MQVRGVFKPRTHTPTRQHGHQTLSISNLISVTCSEQKILRYGRGGEGGGQMKLHCVIWLVDNVKVRLDLAVEQYGSLNVFSTICSARQAGNWLGLKINYKSCFNVNYF